MGLKAEIYRAVHGVEYIWEANSTEEIWGFLLVDAKNACKEINQSIMLWRVCHLWPSGARFFLNCYRQQSSFIMRNRDGTANIIHSREGVTKGDPMPMVDYGIGIITMMKCLKSMYPDVTQPCYSDYYGALGTFDNLDKYFISLKRNGADRGY